MVGIFKKDIFLIIFFGIFDIAFKIASSFVLAKVIESIIDNDKN